MNKGARYEIRRAATDGLVYEYCSSPDVATVDAFCGFYNTFAAQKGLAKAPRTRMLLVSRSGALSLSRVSLGHETLVWHAYLTVGSRARLTHSASLYRGTADVARRQLIGRANRFHHWQDIICLRAHGIATLDLGGWYPGTENSQLLQINKFKEEFGGHVVRGFNCTRGITLRGRLVLWIRSANWK